MEALKRIEQMPFFKDDLNQMADQIVKSLIDGDVDPLEMAIRFKAIEEMIKIVKEKCLSGMALTEAEKYGKEFQLKGVKISVREMGVSYDYSKSGDKAWSEIESNISLLKSNQKERETFIKSLKDPITLVDEDTGETYKVYPPAKKSTTGIAISFK